MATADDEEAYHEPLASPAPVSRRESIASQFQREILGHRTPEPDAQLLPPVAEELHEQHTEQLQADAPQDGDDDQRMEGNDANAHPTEDRPAPHVIEVVDDDGEDSDSHAQTLSPTKAAQLIREATQIDSPVVRDTRNNTSSPGMLKKMLRKLAAGMQSSSANGTSNTTSPAAEELQLSAIKQRRMNAEFVETSAHKSKRRRLSISGVEREEIVLSASKRPRTEQQDGAEDTEQQTEDADQTHKSDSDSFTESLFPSRLLSAEEVNEIRSHEETKHSEPVLETRIPTNKSTPMRRSPATKAGRRSTLEPTDAESLLSEMMREMNGERTSAKTTPRKQTPEKKSPARSGKKPSPQSPALDASPSQRTRSKTRRATVEPQDITSIMAAFNSEETARNSEADSNSHQDANRRETIDEEGLDELRSAQGSASPEGTQRTGDATDQAQDQTVDEENNAPVSNPAPENEAESVEQIAEDEEAIVDSATSSPIRQNSFKRARPSPSPGSRRHDRSPTVGTPEHAVESVVRDGEAIFSPPPASTMPLKSCFSAKKRRTGPDTPSKSVNFGPSQGAEFNLGSPSTSMTPMAAKKARAMFPLDKPSPVSSESDMDEDDDEETSLNSSILDEADARDSDDNDGHDQEQKEGEQEEHASLEKQITNVSITDIFPHRRASSSVNKLTDRNNRRYSLRGMSPLDNQANARRQRRRTINITSSSSPTTDVSVASSSAPALISSFLSSSEVVTQLENRVPYADSSETSDEGEDMEITGDYSVLADAAMALHTASQERIITSVSTSATVNRFTESPAAIEQSANDQQDAAEDTVELGSLGDLVAESDGYEAAASNRMPALDASLDPIQEEEEDRASSAAPSMMSLASSDDESDPGSPERRKSLAVNLSMEFERVGLTSPTENEGSSTRHSYKSPKKHSPTKKHMSMEDLLLLAKLEEVENSIAANDHLEKIAVEIHSLDGLVRLSFSDACKDVVQWHTEEISSWASGLSDVLPSLMNEHAPDFLNRDSGDEARVKARVKAIQKLYSMETSSVLSGCSQWLTKMEKQLIDNLNSCAAELTDDVTALQTQISNDMAKKEAEFAAIKDLIEREKKMSEMLDAIDEQQVVRDEYAVAVDTLENECASLSLEESVLQRQLQAMKGKVSSHEVTSKAAFNELQHSVLEHEELFVIQESLNIWSVHEATSSHLKLGAQFEDVLFDVDVTVDVVFDHGEGNSPSTYRLAESFSTDVTSQVKLRQTGRNLYISAEHDVVYLIQQKLLDSVQLSPFAVKKRTRASRRSWSTENNASLQEMLGQLERLLSRSFQFLRELRTLSKQFPVTYSVDDSMLWIEFVTFPSAVGADSCIGAKFVVGFKVTNAYPFTDLDAIVQVSYGEVRAFNSVAIE